MTQTHHFFYFSLQATHIVSELDTEDDVLKKLKIEDEDLWCEETEILNVKWLTESYHKKSLLPTEPFRLPRKKVRRVLGALSQFHT